jgi:cytochrome P450 family 6
MSYEEIAAQVFIFYIAGTESSTSTISYTIYELSQNEELMKRACEDIESTLQENDGKFSYEAVMNMKFIDLCVKETLRKYVALPILNRECTKSYQIPGTNFTIEPGTSIIISLLGIHRDENYFPRPEEYDPDRFTEEKKAYDEDMYMPFGSGPRNCIAFRLGLMVSKVAIVKILMNYKIEMFKKKELEFDTATVALLPKKGECLVKIANK